MALRRFDIKSEGPGGIRHFSTITEDEETARAQAQQSNDDIAEQEGTTAYQIAEVEEVAVE